MLTSVVDKVLLDHVDKVGKVGAPSVADEKFRGPDVSGVEDVDESGNRW